MPAKPRASAGWPSATPALGGLAILAACSSPPRCGSRARSTSATRPEPPPVPAGPCTPLRSWWRLPITLIGAIDDAHPLRPQWKLLGQIAVAVIAVEAGAVVTDVTIPFVGLIQLPNTGGVLTVIWLVGLLTSSTSPTASTASPPVCARLTGSRSRSSRSTCTSPVPACSQRSCGCGALGSRRTASRRLRSSWATRARTRRLPACAGRGYSVAPRRGRRADRAAVRPRWCRSSTPGFVVAKTPEVQAQAVERRRQPLPSPDGADSDTAQRRTVAYLYRLDAPRSPASRLRSGSCRTPTTAGTLSPRWDGGVLCWWRSRPAST